mgnify:CR=1 FL=1
MTHAEYRCLAFVCLSLLTTLPAQADEGDVFTPYVGYGMFHDDNLLRAPNGGNRVSDSWRRTTFGVRVDKSISRQQLTADLSINDTRYDRFDQYDHDGRKLGANWKWALGNHFSGNVGSRLIEDLTPFEDTFTRSVRTQRRTYIDGGWRFHPSWRVRAAYSRDGLDYEEIPSAKLQLNTSEVGIDYLARSHNRAGLLLRHSVGEYPNSNIGTASNYTQDEIKANILWQLTGKTGLEFLGGWAQRRYNDASARDFTGPDARLTVNWEATGKTSFKLATWRELGSSSDLSANYSRNTGASVAATWQATAKIGVDASASVEDRDYNGIAFLPDIPPSERSDRYRKDTIGITYFPLRQWRVNASVYRQQLDSNLTDKKYSTNGIQLTTRYEF